MILALPSSSKQEDFTITHSNPKQIITKSCLTTYTFYTTYLHNGNTTVRSTEKVISNRHTEKLDYMPSLLNTPELVVGIFPTTYHYYNIISNTSNDIDIVYTSSYTVINTVTGPEDYISYLQSSEEATPLQDTNTYYSRVTLRNSMQDHKLILTDENILTQVIITESIPPRGETNIVIYATNTFLTTVTDLVSGPDTDPASGANPILQSQYNNEVKTINNKFKPSIETVITNVLSTTSHNSFLVSGLGCVNNKKKEKVEKIICSSLEGQSFQKDSSLIESMIYPNDTKNNTTKLIVRTRPNLHNKFAEYVYNATNSNIKDEETTNNYNYTRTRPLQDVQSSSSIDELIGSLNLQRIRPVLNVMADLLHKNIINRHIDQPMLAPSSSSSSEKKKNQANATRNVPMLNVTRNIEMQPIYIPVQMADELHYNRNTEENTNKSASHSDSLMEASLHTKIPEVVFSNNWLNTPTKHNDFAIFEYRKHYDNMIHEYRNLSQYIQSPATPGNQHQQSILDNGIAIRPGEIINANADVIIGKPNGIDASFIGYRSSIDMAERNIGMQTSSKMKAWAPSTIPISPPRIIENRAAPRIVGYTAYNIIHVNSRPTRISNSYPKYITPSSYLLQSFPGGLEPSTTYLSLNKHNNIYGSEHQISNINSQLYNNEIVEIMQVPQIFSTRYPATIRYPLSFGSQPFRSKYMPKSSRVIHPSIVPAFSAHQLISFQSNVLSHNINMNVSPLTFNKDHLNDYPVITDVKGGQRFSALPQMSLIQIPPHKSRVDVQLTPQRTQLYQEALEFYKTIQPTTFKQRTQYISQVFNNIIDRNLISFNVNKINNTLNSSRVEKTQSVANKQSKNVINWIDSNSIATNKQFVYVIPKNRTIAINKHPNMSKWNSSSISDSNQLLSAKKNANILGSSIDPLEFSTAKDLGFSIYNLKNKNTPSMTNISNILYLATGDGFHNNQSFTSDIISSFAPATRTAAMQSIWGYQSHIANSSILPSPLTLQLTSLIMIPSKIKNQLNSNLNIRPENTLFRKNSLRFEKKHYGSTTSLDIWPNSTQNIRMSEPITKSSVEQSSSIYKKPIKGQTKHKPFLTITEFKKTIKEIPILLTWSTTTGTTTDMISNKITPTSSYNVLAIENRNTSRSIRQSKTKASVSIEPFLSSTKSRININDYIDINSNAISINHSGNISNHSDIFLESSEVMLFTGIKKNYVADRLNTYYSEKKVYRNKSSASERESTTTTIKQLSIFRTAELNFPLNTDNTHDNGIVKPSTLSLESSFIPNAITRNKEYIYSKNTSHSSSMNYDKTSMESSAKNTHENVLKNVLAKTSLINMENIGSSNRPNTLVTTDYPNKVNDVDINEDSNTFFEEETESHIHLNNILLGGVLIAMPSKFSKESNLKTLNNCNPSCKSSKNEICSAISGHGNRCECRLGFVRIFPDRPCKPTYTHELHIPTNRIGSYILNFNQEFLNASSNQFRYLSSIILDAIDRMIMQSDLRDEYYGVRLKKFSASTNDGIIAQLLLQLSENRDEKHIEAVLKKNLRLSNYSIGGTDLHMPKDSINSLTIQDFNECKHKTFNDCSMNATCFNLVGSYTCVCRDGYADESENTNYPGRKCSDKVIGCNKCNYHGICITPNLSEISICECFGWYTGSTCQLNLKILLISLIVMITVIVVLIACLLFNYAKIKVPNRGNLKTPSDYNHPYIMTSSRKLQSDALPWKQRSNERQAILIDSNSECSHYSASSHTKNKKNIAKRQRRSPIVGNNHNIDLHGSQIDDTKASQRNYSQTVMIPRAKYSHPNALPHTHLMQQSAVAEVEKTSLGSSNKNVIELSLDNGALVSAGFEVSAIVSDQGVDSNRLAHQFTENEYEKTPSHLSKVQKTSEHIAKPSVATIDCSSGQIQTMDTWMNNIHTHVLSSDVRSFDETMVQVVRKTMYQSFDMQTQSHTNEELNIMTERDLGSTFLLPHTHLYMPEKIESDMSGFESI
ncbi:uncharacterized protein LOC127565783 isoform X1 [Drosophila albomicans]|uniref:Uncharacterized protein LOC127565783 isoform X1 n=4 Tax=nasuta subgroup TaxID=32307 RepID=A0A9C6T916_DROAB|nr:uncharacterized protein LOC127565783 isoform X1 [Drosophila albomicans]